MSKTTLRNVIISLAIFTLVTGAVLIAFLSVLKDSQTLEQQIAAVASQNQQEVALLRLQKIAENSQSERAELASYFLLRDGDSIGFLSEIEALAPSFGITLETKQLQKVEQDGKEWIETTFGLVGERESVQDFIKVLENIPYVSRTISINMRGERIGGWEADIIMQVQLLSYDK